MICVGDVLQEVTVVGDDNKGKAGGAEQAFQPFNAVKIEVVRGFVEEKHLRISDKSFGDGKPFAPAAAQARGFTVHAGIAGSVAFRESGAAKRFAQPLFAGGSRNGGAFECGLDDLADRDFRGEV